MKRREFGKSLTFLGIGATLIGGSDVLAKARQSSYAPAEDTSEKYPRAKAMLFNSTPVFILTKNGQREILQFEGRLEMITRMASKNTDGFRFIDLELTKWNGKTFSKGLGQEMEFRMTQVHQSKVTSLVLNQDFPARLDFVIDYDLLADGKVLESGITAKGSAIVNSFNNSLSDVKLSIDSKLPGVLGNSDYEVIFCAA